MKLTVLHKNVFGNDLFYPQDKTGLLICELLEAKSFAEWQVKAMKEAGWKITIKAQEFKV